MPIDINTSTKEHLEQLLKEKGYVKSEDKKFVPLSATQKKYTSFDEIQEGVRLRRKVKEEQAEKAKNPNPENIHNVFQKI